MFLSLTSAVPDLLSAASGSYDFTLLLEEKLEIRSFTADRLAKCEREKLEKPGAEPTMMATFSSTILRSTVSSRQRNMQVGTIRDTV